MESIVIEHKTFGRAMLRPNRMYHFVVGGNPVTKAFLGEDYSRYLDELDSYIGSRNRVSLQHVSHTKASKLLVKCDNCKGEGVIYKRYNHPSLSSARKCYACMGKGEVVIDNPKYIDYQNHCKKRFQN